MPANRITRRTALMGAEETTYGVDPSLSASSHAILYRVGDFSYAVGPAMAQRDVSSPFFRPTEQIQVARDSTLNFSMDLVGSGTAGTASNMGYFLKSCNFSEVISAGSRVEYIAATTSPVSSSFWFNDDGVNIRLGGAVGNLKMTLRAGEIPTAQFSMRGIGAVVDASATPTPVTSTWKVAKPVNPANTAAVLIGCTYSAGAFSGGTSYDWRQCDIDAGNEVSKLFCANVETYRVDDAAAKLEIICDLSAADEVTFHADRTAGTLRTIGLTHGATAGYITMIYAPAARCTAVEPANEGKRRLTKLSYDLFPTSSGNDALRIIQK
jgi:hypothetical protein